MEWGGYPGNFWNSPSKTTYTYKGNTYTNYLGNYWDDYRDTDANGDGIWDTPYSIDGDKDNYPLKDRSENYVKQIRIINFSDHNWIVKSGYCRGPGPNHWSDSEENVWVDDEGLILLILSDMVSILFILMGALIFLIRTLY
jgi:hypothetical protein